MSRHRYQSALLFFLLAGCLLGVTRVPLHAQDTAARSTPAERGPSPETAQRIQQLQDPDPQVVLDALRELGREGALAAFGPIVTLLSTNQTPQLQEMGLIALEKIHYTPPFLLALLQDAGQPVLARSYAAYMLGKMQAQEAVGPLIAALKAPEEEVRSRAIEALGRIKDPRAWKPLILAAHRDPSPTLRSEAKNAVENLNSLPGSNRDPDTLNYQLTSPDLTTRREAARRLSQHGNWWSIDPLAKALKAPDPELQRLAARALGDLQDRRAVQPLIAYLPGSRGKARHTALIALGVLKDDTAVSAIVPYLKDRDAENRKMAARALGKLGSVEAGPALTEAMGDIVPPNRREAARAIGLVGYAGAIPALMEMVDDDVEENQIEAARALGKVGPEAIPYCMRVLDDRNPIVAVTAVNALRNLMAAEAIPKLEQIARHHKDKYLRETALEVAIELKGKLKLKSEGQE